MAVREQGELCLIVVANAMGPQTSRAFLPAVHAESLGVFASRDARLSQEEARRLLAKFEWSSFAWKSNKVGNVFHPTYRVSDFPETFVPGTLDIRPTADVGGLQ